MVAQHFDRRMNRVAVVWFSEPACDQDDRVLRNVSPLDYTQMNTSRSDMVLCSYFLDRNVPTGPVVASWRVKELAGWKA